MYLNYLHLFNELKEKALIVSENRIKTLNEIDERKQTWRKLIQTTLDNINDTYKKYLSKIVLMVISDL